MSWGWTPNLIAEFSLAGLFDSRAIGVALWVGLAVLTVTLLILMRTRFGQAKPVSKCVALSVFAHLLLFGHMYATHLVFDAPRGKQESVVQISVEFDAPDEASTLKREETTEPPVPWNAFQIDQQSAPDAAASRPADLAPTETTRTMPEQPSPPALIGEAPPAQLVEVGRGRLTAPDVEPPENDLPQLPHAQVSATPVEDVDPLDTPAESPLTPEPVEASIRAPFAQRQPSLMRTVATRPRETTDNNLLQSNDVARRLATGIESPQATAVTTSQPDGATAASRQATSDATDEQSSDAAASAAVAATRAVAPRRLGDGKPLPPIYQGRFRDRRQMLQKYGGDRRTEQAVAEALAWLAANQAADGSWSARAFGGGTGRQDQLAGHARDGAGANADTGVSGLALLAFMAHGDTHLEGPHRRVVLKGIRFLQQRQRPNGDLSGEAKLYARMYCHGMAALALTEAYALTGDRDLLVAVERAVQFTLDAQHPITGGWRYAPGDEICDLSQFGWQALVIRSADAAGIEIPSSVRHGMERFMRSVSGGRAGGLASYRPTDRPSRPMTAEGLTCRLLLDLDNSNGATREAVSYINEERPGDGEFNLYYWYYATIALMQVQGDDWENWNRAMRAELSRTQRATGVERGSWDPTSRWGGYGGRVYSTAMATLCLEAYYRYLPVLNPDAARTGSRLRSRD